MISAVEAENKVLQSWFKNCVAEIIDHMDDWGRRKVGVESIHHWPGLTYVADLAMEGNATVGNIGETSTWQYGLEELSYPHDRWPASREFKRNLPESEVRLKQQANCNTVQVRVITGKFVSYKFKVMRCLAYSNDLNKCLWILARVVVGVDSRSRQGIHNALDSEKIKVVWRLVDIEAAMEVTKYLKKLASLDPFLSD